MENKFLFTVCGLMFLAVKFRILLHYQIIQITKKIFISNLTPKKAPKKPPTLNNSL